MRLRDKATFFLKECFQLLQPRTGGLNCGTRVIAIFLSYISYIGLDCLYHLGEEEEGHHERVAHSVHFWRLVEIASHMTTRRRAGEGGVGAELARGKRTGETRLFDWRHGAAEGGKQTVRGRPVLLQGRRCVSSRVHGRRRTGENAAARAPRSVHGRRKRCEGGEMGCRGAARWRPGRRAS